MVKKEDEKYGKMTIKAIREGNFYDAGQFAEKIKDKKLVKGLYKKAAVETAGKNWAWFYDAGQFAKKVGNEKLAKEMYRKASVDAVKKGKFRNAEEFAKRAGDKKLTDEIRKRLEK
ncbi:MAG TPA: hypothetical protein VMV95_03220 [Bacillota bacterium]|nr:hypothetical protein [Bacillota bacterium]